MKRLNKMQKMGVYLLLFALLLFVLWLMLGMPRLSAEGAFRRVEQRELLQQSRIIGQWAMPDWHRTGRWPNNGRWQCALVAGVTDSHLYMTQVEHRGLRWNSPNNMVVWSTGNRYTFDLIPWERDNESGTRFTWGAFVYTGQAGMTGRLVLTVGTRAFARDFVTDGQGMAVVTFDELAAYPELYEQVELCTYDLLGGVKYPYSRKTMDVQLEVEAAGPGGVVQRYNRAYPRYVEEE